MNRAFCYSVLLLCLLSCNLQAREMSDAELEKWFQSNEQLLPESETSDAVNEGQLEFLLQPPDKPVHHHHNTITITGESLLEGWVELKQCHRHLDNVPRTEILFRSDRVRNLKIERSKNIGKAWVEKHSVQLEDVGKRAEICLSARTRALKSRPEGGYLLSNGPFMRRFLDGYYPMHVTMEVRFAGSGLELVSISPDAQQGFSVSSQPEQIKFDAWFAGRLQTRIHFRAQSL